MTQDKRFPASLLMLLTALLVMVSVFFALILYFDVENKSIWLREHGVIETASVVGYFVCAVLMLGFGKRAYVTQYHYFFLMVILFALRELDFDKKFTTMGLFKSRFYLSEQVPYGEKIIGLMVVALVLYVCFAIIKNHAGDLWTGVKKLNPVHLGSILVIVLLVLAKTLDGFARKMRDFNIHISERLSNHLSAMEELLELAIPMVLIYVVSTFLSSRST